MKSAAKIQLPFLHLCNQIIWVNLIKSIYKVKSLWKIGRRRIIVYTTRARALKKYFLNNF